MGVIFETFRVTRILDDGFAATAQEALNAAQERVERVLPIRIELPPSRLQSSHTLIKAEDLSLCYGERRVFGPITLTITGPKRVALTGQNGAGKSSLLRVLSGAIEPTTGRVRRSADRIAVLDQHLLLLGDGESALEAMRRHSPSLTAHQAHAALARFGFRGDWSARDVSAMSGGERVRLALACLFSGEGAPAMLILDEPTSHLDIDSREALIYALNDFQGAVLLITHDVFLAEATADQLWLVKDGEAKPYSGDLSDYRNLVLQADRGKAVKEKSKPEKAEVRPDPKRDKNEQRRLASEKRKAAGAITVLERVRHITAERVQDLLEKCFIENLLSVLYQFHQSI